VVGLVWGTFIFPQAVAQAIDAVRLVAWYLGSHFLAKCAITVGVLAGRALYLVLPTEWAWFSLLVGCIAAATFAVIAGYIFDDPIVIAERHAGGASPLLSYDEVRRRNLLRRMREGPSHSASSAVATWQEARRFFVESLKEGGLDE
jgi:hypothetical protein